MISLREYLESKNALIQAYLKNPTSSSTYVMQKYCKIPVMVGAKLKYVSLRPNDLVEVVSLSVNDSTSVHHVRFICEHDLTIADDKYAPKWTYKKMAKWLDQSAKPITHSEADDIAATFLG